MKLENKKDVSATAYQGWISYLAKLYSDITVNIITNYRGGVPAGIHLNNVLPNSTLSILKYQTRDDNDESVSWLINNTNHHAVNVFIDDIWDTGKSSGECLEFLHYERIFVDHKNTHYLVSTSFNQNGYIKNNEPSWWVFPWER